MHAACLSSSIPSSTTSSSPFSLVCTSPCLLKMCPGGRSQEPAGYLQLSPVSELCCARSFPILSTSVPTAQPSLPSRAATAPHQAPV